MKKILIIQFLIASTFISAQNYIFHLGTVENSPKGIVFSQLPGGGAQNPSAFQVDEISRLLYVIDQETQMIRTFNYSMANLDNISIDYYPSISEELFVLKDLFIGQSLNHLMIFTKSGKTVFDNSSVLDKKTGFLKFDKYLLFSDNNNRLRAVNTEGDVISNSDVKVVINQSNSIIALQKLVLNNNQIIIDNIGYSFNFKKQKDLWEKQYGTTTDVSIGDYKFLGKDYDNNTYWKYSYTETFVYSPIGELIAKIYTPSKTIVTEAGNIYSMNASEEGIKFYLLPRTWGTVNKLSIAVNGLIGNDYDNFVTNALSKMSKSDLRILRNYLFAIYNYSFKSEDLKEYFSNYDWYSPDPNLENSLDYLTDAQKKLFEYIRTIE